MDPELEQLIEQAARNLRTLEQLVGHDHRPDTLLDFQERLQRLKAAYLKETNSLTRQVLRRAIERRTGIDRRRLRDPQPIGT